MQENAKNALSRRLQALLNEKLFCGFCLLWAGVAVAMSVLLWNSPKGLPQWFYQTSPGVAIFSHYIAFGILCASATTCKRKPIICALLCFLCSEALHWVFMAAVMRDWLG